jgi:adenylate cyclase
MTSAPTPPPSGGSTSISQSDALSFPIPANEPQRLNALRALDILDSPSETAYDEIAELAAQICGCPIGYISFIDNDRRWLKAKYGLASGVTTVPRAATVCSTTICGAEM